MELPRLIVLTSVLGVSAALFYARGAPARELAPPAPAAALAAPTTLVQAPPLVQTTPAPAAVPVTKHHVRRLKKKRRSPQHG